MEIKFLLIQSLTRSDRDQCRGGWHSDIGQQQPAEPNQQAIIAQRVVFC